MKQHIDIKQLEELTEKQKKKLRYWLIEHHCQPTFIEPEGCLTPSPKEVVYLPNIGQMIECLSEQEVFSKDFKGDIPANRLITDKEANQIVIAWNGVELADALWEAVKEVLENEQKNDK